MVLYFLFCPRVNVLTSLAETILLQFGWLELTNQMYAPSQNVSIALFFKSNYKYIPEKIQEKERPKKAANQKRTTFMPAQNSVEFKLGLNYCKFSIELISAISVFDLHFYNLQETIFMKTTKNKNNVKI